ncbi:MAG: ATP-binding protein [Verrucomicrobiota bacterium]
MDDKPPEDQNDNVPFRDVVGFVRQLSHDLRNHLNAAELQSVFISEIAADAELKAEIKRLREMISTLGTVLQKLSADLGQIKLTSMPYGASDFVEDLRIKIAQEFPQENAAITWDLQLDDSAFDVDPQLLQQAFIELFRNAFQHDRGQGAIAVTAKIGNGQFVFTLSEPKTQFELSTENWGHEPFRKVGRSHYGLGLNRARSIMGAHNGELRARYDSATSTLVTTISLPLSQKRS